MPTPGIVRRCLLASFARCCPTSFDLRSHAEARLNNASKISELTQRSVSGPVVQDEIVQPEFFQIGAHAGLEPCAKPTLSACSKLPLVFEIEAERLASVVGVQLTTDCRWAAESVFPNGHKHTREAKPFLLRIQWFEVWLGREDSNLRVAESKSAWKSLFFRPHFEKYLQNRPPNINRLDPVSKCRSSVACPQRRAIAMIDPTSNMLFIPSR
jgi:hypothetical protein